MLDRIRFSSFGCLQSATRWPELPQFRHASKFLTGSYFTIAWTRARVEVVDVDRKRERTGIGSPGRLVAPRGLIEGERPRETRKGVPERGGDRARCELLRE